ncbi:MAG: hypothetical protein KAU29_12535 [Gammaproteobacteria bacterium]|nr:hypothetical protein [Gammaproteobacteria bacterium]
MAKILFIVTMLIMLGGCVSLKPVEIDVSTSETLPKEIAVRYLQKVKSENIYRSIDVMCVFADDGFYRDPSKSSYPNNLIKYEDSFMSLYMFTDNSYKFFISRDKEFFTGSCIVAYKENVHEEKPELFFNKIPTALKSLGVKVKDKK